MPSHASIPRDLRLLPFRASDAIASGLRTRSALRGSAWRRLLPDVHVRAEVDLDHRMWCRAAMLFVGPGAAISGLSAAYLWGIDQLPLGSPGSLTVAVEVTAPLRVRRVGSPAVRLIRSPLLPGDVTVVGGLPRPRAQHEVRDAAGRFVARLDLAYPKWRLGIEYDGDQHRDRAAFRADLTRRMPYACRAGPCCALPPRTCGANQTESSPRSKPSSRDNDLRGRDWMISAGRADAAERAERATWSEGRAGAAAGMAT